MFHVSRAEGAANVCQLLSTWRPPWQKARELSNYKRECHKTQSRERVSVHHTDCYFLRMDFFKCLTGAAILAAVFVLSAGRTSYQETGDSEVN